MINYEIKQSLDKYIIHKTGDEVPGKFGLYLSHVCKDGYKWSYDYTYAKEMTLKTAQKHLTILKAL